MNITEEASIAEIDEAIGHVADRLKDRYGNRLNWKTKAILQESLDDLLDYRLMLMKGENYGDGNVISGHTQGISGESA